MKRKAKNTSRQRAPARKQVAAGTSSGRGSVIEPSFGNQPLDIPTLIGVIDAESNGPPRQALAVVANCSYQHGFAVAALLVTAKKRGFKGNMPDPAVLRVAVEEVKGRIYVGWVPYGLATTVVLDALLGLEPEHAAYLHGIRAELERLANMDRGDTVVALVLDDNIRLDAFRPSGAKVILSAGGSA